MSLENYENSMVSKKLLYQIFFCAIIMSIRQLINNSIIHNQLHENNFASITGAKLFAVFL